MQLINGYPYATIWIAISAEVVNLVNICRLLLSEVRRGIMNIDELRIIKDAKEMSAVDIAMKSGVPVSTVYKIFQRQTINPRKETMAAIERALGIRPEEDENTFREDSPYSLYNAGSNAMKADSDMSPIDALIAATGKRQGEFTTKDLEDWPEDFRIELIDGVIYDISSPTTRHQIIAFELAKRLDRFIEENKGKCVVLVAPVGVMIDQNDKTELQPDVSIVCDRGKFKDGIIWGSPDFVAEVLSPSTGKRDLGIKMLKYKHAGVKEFWAVDPKEKHIIVYLFEESDIIRMYTFKDTVPVSIYDGACSIDFSQIEAYLADIFGNAE